MSESIRSSKNKKKTTKSEISAEALEQIAEENAITIPPGYVGINYPSKGNLSIPATLHFKDYTLADIAKLSSKKDKTKAIIEILDSLMLEDVTCADMHPQEFLYTRVMLMKSFYGNKLRNVRVYVDDTLTGKDLTAESNITEVDIDISKIPITKLNSKIKKGKNRLILSSNDIKYKFRFPKMKDILLADKYIEQKYAEKDQEFSDIRMKLATINTSDIAAILEHITYDEYESFKHYTESRTLDRLEILRTCQLVGYDDIEFSDSQLKEKLEVEVPYSVWTSLNGVIDSFDFGLSTTVKLDIYHDGDLKKNQERRIAFRDHYLIPKNAVREDASGIAYEFG